MNETPPIQPPSPFLQPQSVACKDELAKAQLAISEARERIKAKLGRKVRHSRKTLP